MVNRNQKTTNGGRLLKFPSPSFQVMKTDDSTQKRESYSSGNVESSKKILIVDDDSTISRMLGELLKEWGYEIVYASNGREGLRVFKGDSLDGILLELEMPVMDGWTMLDEVRWENHEVPVVVMSGGVPVDSIRNLLCEGAQGFLTKPFQFEDVKKKCLQIFGAPIGMRKQGGVLVA